MAPGVHDPFPVAPGDVPERAVWFVFRTMARHGQPVDEELARVIVAGLIGVLAEAEAASVAVEPA